MENFKHSGLWSSRIARCSRATFCLILVLLDPLAFLSTCSGPIGGSTKPVYPDTECKVKWPVVSSSNRCPLQWCSVNGTAKAYQGSTVHPPSWCIRLLAPNILTTELAGFANKTAPARPSDLKVTPVYTSLYSFRIILTWQDPSDIQPCTLLGYRVRLLNKLETALGTYDFPKEFSASRKGDPGLNFVRLETNRESDYCSADDPCLFLNINAVDQMFQAPNTFFIEVISLPVRSMSAYGNQTSQNSFQTQGCYSDGVDCLDNMVQPFKISDSDQCHSLWMPSRTNKTRKICQCEFRNIFNLSSLLLPNKTSLEFQYVWGKSITKDVKIRLSIIISHNRTSRTALFWSIVTLRWEGSSVANYIFRLNFTLSPRMEVTYSYQREDQHVADWHGVQSSLEIPAPPTQMTRELELTLSRDSPVATDTTTPDFYHSTSFVISAVTAGILVVMLVGIALVVWFRNTQTAGRTDVIMNSRSLRSDCYICYSRITATNKEHAEHLYLLLKDHGITSYLDAIHLGDLADIETEWIQEKMLSSAFVLVLLSDDYPWNLSSCAAMHKAGMGHGELARSLLESELLPSVIPPSSGQCVLPIIIELSGYQEPEIPQLLYDHDIIRLPENFGGRDASFETLLSCIRSTEFISQL